MHLLMDHFASRHLSRATIALWVVVCLLFAQWLGFAHAIGHAGLKADAISEAIYVQSLSVDKTSPVFDHQKASNACAALDAATLGAGLHSAPILALLLTLSPSKIDCAVHNPWQQSFIALFSSRAPPFFH